jgi:hypothetical protein
MTWLTTIVDGPLSWERVCVQEWLETRSTVGRYACCALVLASPRQAHWRP